MKDVDPNPVRTFVISDKTPNSWLVAQRSLQQVNVRWRVAGDVVNNARELERKIDWGEVLRHVSWIRYQTDVLYGHAAISESIAFSLASIVVHMKWDMHSPEVVYMSGFHILVPLVKRIEFLDGNIAKASERKFESEEKKEEVIRKERDEAGRLSKFRNRLEESLEEYVRQNLKEDPSYLQVLQRVLYVKLDTRGRIITLLKKGEIESAASILQNKK